MVFFYGTGLDDNHSLSVTFYMCHYLVLRRH